MILSSEISVIIQGPIVGKPGDDYSGQQTQQCIDNIRKQLSDAEIIVSTWKGSDISHLSNFDKIIMSEDPGAITYNDFELKNVYNNNNRQIVSTFEGLKLATKRYAMKFRSDFRLENTNFLNYFGKYSKRGKYRFLKERIVTINLGSRDSVKQPILYSISDLFQFGLTEDLQMLWGIPLQIEPIITRAFPYSYQFPTDPFRANQYKMNYSCEQYIWYAFSKTQGLDLSLKYFCEVPYLKILPSFSSTMDNFTIVDYRMLGVLPPPRLIHCEDVLIDYNRWLLYYSEIFEKKSMLFKVKYLISVSLRKWKQIILNSF